MSDSDIDVPNPTFTYSFCGGTPEEDDKTNFIFTCDRDFLFMSDDQEKIDKMFSKVMKDNNWTTENYVAAVPENGTNNDFGPIVYYRGVVSNQIDDNRDFTPEEAKAYQEKYIKPTEKDELTQEIIDYLKFLMKNDHPLDSNQAQDILRLFTKNQMMTLYGQPGIYTHDELVKKWEE